MSLVQEIDEMIKKSGFSTKEPDDVLAIQEPQASELGRSPASAPTYPMGSHLSHTMGQSESSQYRDIRKEASKKGIIISDSTFGDAVLGVGAGVFYGQMVSSYTSELAVVSNIAVHSIGSYFCFRAITDQKNNGLQKAMAGIGSLFLGLTGFLSMVDLIKAKPGTKLKMITMPKVAQKLMK